VAGRFAASQSDLMLSRTSGEIGVRMNFRHCDPSGGEQS
jgi:hypothetical protein